MVDTWDVLAPSRTGPAGPNAVPDVTDRTGSDEYDGVDTFETEPPTGYHPTRERDDVLPAPRVGGAPPSAVNRVTSRREADE